MRSLLRFAALIIAFLFPGATFAQCESVGCNSGQSCQSFEGAYCAGYGCYGGTRCYTIIGVCSGSGKACATRYCIPAESCPPNPYASVPLLAEMKGNHLWVEPRLRRVVSLRRFRRNIRAALRGSDKALDYVARVAHRYRLAIAIARY